MTLDSTATVSVPAIQSSAPIVVGVDGTAASLAALRWAAAEAAAHDVPLVALHIRDPRSRKRAVYAQAAGRDADPEDGQSVLVELIERSLTSSVERVFEVGVPSEILVRRSDGARMLVLGHGERHRRHDGEPFRHDPALGTVARACVARAACPVVVVPIPAQQSAPTQSAPTPHEVPELVGARAVYPRVNATSVAH